MFARVITAQAGAEGFDGTILTEIDRENLGWFGLDDITPGQRREVRRIITEHLVDDAEREFPADAPGRASGLELLKDLAAMVSDGADH
jgi:hypothetical protein